jgi:hypothetical protein
MTRRHEAADGGAAFAARRCVMAGPVPAVRAQPQQPGVFTPTDETPEMFPAHPARDDTVALCSACHNFKLVAAQGMTREQWSGSLDWMTERHNMPALEGDERKAVLDYLETAFSARRPLTGRRLPQPVRAIAPNRFQSLRGCRTLYWAVWSNWPAARLRQGATHSRASGRVWAESRRTGALTTCLAGPPGRPDVSARRSRPWLQGFGQVARQLSWLWQPASPRPRPLPQHERTRQGHRGAFSGITRASRKATRPRPAIPAAFRAPLRRTAA